MSLTSVAALIWPALFVMALIPIYLMFVTKIGYTQQTVVAGVLAGILLLVLLYTSPVIRDSIRWILSVIGFAAPLTLGVIAIRHMVEQT